MVKICMLFWLDLEKGQTSKKNSSIDEDFLMGNERNWSAGIFAALVALSF